MVDFALAALLLLSSRKSLPERWTHRLIIPLTLLTAGCLMAQFYGFLRFAQRY